MEQPLVSVLMTAYNREKYIAEAIESVIISTYQNWELIIVDDQSKDRSVEIAKQYEARDSRIKVFINKENLGDYPNRNQAARYAKGKYLKYLDADDLIYPYGLETMVYYIENYPDVAYTLSMVNQDLRQPYPIYLSPKESYIRHYTISPVFHKSPLGALIKREIFNEIGGFSGKQHVGDFEIWHKLSSKYPMLLITGGLGWYRSHDDQQMNDNRNIKSVPLKYYMVSMQQLNSLNCPLTSTEKHKLSKVIEKAMCKYILHPIKKLQFKEARLLKNAAGYTWHQIIKSII
jgi:glycosyltransferase involved in cell wall biosynthesis